MSSSLNNYILKNWPLDVPQDCSSVFHYMTCLERSSLLLDWCESCRIYAGLAEQYYETGGIDNG